MGGKKRKETVQRALKHRFPGITSRDGSPIDYERTKATRKERLRQVSDDEGEATRHEERKCDGDILIERERAHRNRCLLSKRWLSEKTPKILLRFRGVETFCQGEVNVQVRGQRRERVTEVEGTRCELSCHGARTNSWQAARLVAPLPRLLVRFLVDQSPRSCIVPLFLLSGVISLQ